jgi:hypothetical protein
MSAPDLPDLAELYKPAALDAAVQPDQLHAGYVAALERDLRELGERLARERELADLRVGKATDEARRQAELVQLAQHEARQQREYLGQILGHLAWVRTVFGRLLASKVSELSGNARAWVQQGNARLGELAPTDLGRAAERGTLDVSSTGPWPARVAVTVSAAGVRLECSDGLDTQAWVRVVVDEAQLLRWLLLVQHRAGQVDPVSSPM